MKEKERKREKKFLGGKMEIYSTGKVNKKRK